MSISGGFVIRALAGVAAVSSPISPWLIVCTGLLTLFLGFSKRRHEIATLGEGAAVHRRNLAGLLGAAVGRDDEHHDLGDHHRLHPLYLHGLREAGPDLHDGEHPVRGLRGVPLHAARPPRRRRQPRHPAPLRQAAADRAVPLAASWLARSSTWCPIGTAETEPRPRPRPGRRRVHDPGDPLGLRQASPLPSKTSTTPSYPRSSASSPSLTWAFPPLDVLPEGPEGLRPNGHKRGDLHVWPLDDDLTRQARGGAEERLRPQGLGRPDSPHRPRRHRRTRHRRYRAWSSGVSSAPSP